MNVYERFGKMAETRKFFDEYRNLARLVDDLDIRFWKMFVTRESRRAKSIDEAIAEKNIRREYQSCVEDKVVTSTGLKGRPFCSMMFSGYFYELGCGQ